MILTLMKRLRWAYLPGVLLLLSACSGGSSPPVLTSIEIAPNPIFVGLNKSLALTAFGVYSNNSRVNLTSQVTWSSADATIATVDATGLVSGVLLDKTTVTAKLGSVTSLSVAINVTSDGSGISTDLLTARFDHAAALLIGDAQGRALVVGGYNGATTLGSTELYTPGASGVAGTWTQAGYLNFKRGDHSAIALDDGTVLVAGGVNGPNDIKQTEIFDPAGSGNWTVQGALNEARSYHAAVKLKDGKVMLVGGTNNSTHALSSAEIYDPLLHQWTLKGSLKEGRNSLSATLLANGKVLVAGGYDHATNGSLVALASAEIYDPATGLWTSVAPMHTGRYTHSATLLPDGKVLVAGGIDQADMVLTSAEVYDPVSDTWTTVGAMSIARYNHPALLFNGKAMVMGGTGSNGDPLSSVEVFDATGIDPLTGTTGTWIGVANMQKARVVHTITLLGDGSVLVAGGDGLTGELASVELHW